MTGHRAHYHEISFLKLGSSNFIAGRFPCAGARLIFYHVGLLISSNIVISSRQRLGFVKVQAYNAHIVHSKSIQCMKITGTAFMTKIKARVSTD